MRFLLASIMLLFGASAANAALTFDFTDGAGDQEQTVMFDGNSNNTFVPGLTGEVTITLNDAATDGTTWVFNVSIENTTDGTLFDNSRISVFGWNADPNILSGSASGAFDNVVIGAESFPNGFGAIEGCVKEGGGPTCNGGGGAGANLGETINFELTLVLSGPSAALTLDNLGIRYQDIDPVDGNCSFCNGSGTGTPTMIPEPATWMMMILGFGMIGMQLKRRQRTALELA